MPTDTAARTLGLITRLFDWWCGRGEDGELERELREHATYDGGTPALTIEEFIWRAQEGAQLEDVQLIDVIAQEERGALMYECKDPVTLLKHRVAWFVETRADHILRIREVISQVQ